MIIKTDEFIKFIKEFEYELGDQKTQEFIKNMIISMALLYEKKVEADLYLTNNIKMENDFSPNYQGYDDFLEQNCSMNRNDE